MLLLRILGVWFLLAATIALVVDGTKSLATPGTLIVTPFALQWQQLSPSTFAAAREAIVQSGNGWLWDPVLVWLMQAPSWAIFGFLGMGLYWLGRKRKRLEVYIN